jgi:hypothetical protein
LILKKKDRNFSARYGVEPVCAMPLYNDGAGQPFPQMKNLFSYWYGGVFPSALRYVLPHGNHEPQGTGMLLLLHAHAHTDDRVSISGNDPRT